MEVNIHTEKEIVFSDQDMQDLVRICELYLMNTRDSVLTIPTARRRQLAEDLVEATKEDA